MNSNQVHSWLDQSPDVKKPLSKCKIKINKIYYRSPKRLKTINIGFFFSLVPNGGCDEKIRFFTSSLIFGLGKPQKVLFFSGRATKRGGGYTGVPLRQKELF